MSRRPLGWRLVRCEDCRGTGIAPPVGVKLQICDTCEGQGELPAPLVISPMAWIGLAVMLLSLALLYHALFEVN